jgi:hypothetical protein
MTDGLYETKRGVFVPAIHLSWEDLEALPESLRKQALKDAIAQIQKSFAESRAARKAQP